MPDAPVVETSTSVRALKPKSDDCGLTVGKWSGIAYFSCERCRTFHTFDRAEAEAQAKSCPGVKTGA